MRHFLLSTIMAVGLTIGIAEVAPVRAQGADEAAQNAHWDRVKGSKDAAEVRGYLEKYPSGMYAPLARIRLRNLEGGTASPGAAAPPPSAPPKSAAPPAPPVPPSAASTPSTSPPSAYIPPKAPPAPPSRPAPSATASALTSQDAIREVQDLLYNLNYQVPRTGRLTADTREAIRQWQTNMKVTATGDVSELQLAQLRQIRVPMIWGALAYYSKGASSTIWNSPSRAAAERDALAACRKNAGATCKVLTVANSICAALGFYNATVRGRQYWGAYAMVRPTLGQATDSALSECRNQAQQPNGCGIRTTVCADGSHRR